MTRDEALARGSLSLDSKTKPRSVFDSQESNTDLRLRLDRPGNTARNSPPGPLAVDFTAATLVAEIQAACPELNAGLARRAAAAVAARQISIDWLRDLLRRLPAESPWKYFKAALAGEVANTGQHVRDPPRR